MQSKYKNVSIPLEDEVSEVKLLEYTGISGGPKSKDVVALLTWIVYSGPHGCDTIAYQLTVMRKFTLANTQMHAPSVALQVDDAS